MDEPRRNLLQLLMHGLMQRDNYPSESARIEAARLLKEYEPVAVLPIATRQAPSLKFPALILAALLVIGAVVVGRGCLAPEHGSFGAAANPRSPHWPKVRADFLKLHPACEVCSRKDGLEIHHRRPFHLDPSLELDPTNLITLCREHHLLFGHLDSWSSWNETVAEDAAAWREKIKTRP